MSSSHAEGGTRSYAMLTTHLSGRGGRVEKLHGVRVEFERDRLTSAVRRVALLSNERSRAVTFQMDPGQVEVSSRSPEFGDAREVLMVEYDGPSVKICFNAQYVLDFLNAVETERVSLDFKDDVSQSLMRPVGPEGYDYLYVIMPMRL